MHGTRPPSPTPLPRTHQAEGIYRAALLRYPSSPKLVRGYAKFLEAVKNNPWKAARYFK